VTLDVLHVSRFFHPHVGGTENFIAALAAATDDRGVRSSVLTSRRYAGDLGPAPAVAVTRVPVFGPDAFPIPRGGLGEIAEAVAAADIVHVHDLRFLLEAVVALAKRHRKPLVLTTHGLIFHTRRLRAVKWAAWHSYYRALLGQFDAVWCGSSADLSYCRRNGLRNARLVPNPVAIEGFSSTSAVERQERTLIFFGRIAPNKGLERLGPLLEANPGWTLTVVGTGSPRDVNALRSRLEDLSRVSFVGSLANEDLYRELARHACAVLPSRAEGFGLTLVEAMASGIPVVASDIPSYREIAEGSPVRLVDFGTSEAAAAVRDAVVAWDEAAARRRAEDFSWRARADEFATLYLSLAGG
jgi:alpha-1,3-mannosyltransferase